MPIDEPRPVPATGVPTTLALIAAIAVGALLRTLVADQPLFADELSTTWIVTAHGLGGVLSTVHSNAEITPPLTFVASWFAAQLSTAPEVLRSPALISGVALIPLVYAIGLRTVGRAAALVAALLTAVSPFMVYYSTEARAYGLMMALVAVSTLALLLAVDHGRRRWWVLYAAASAGAAYSHYTCVFLLAVQFAWVLWAHPEARRAAVLANVGAALAFLPWITGLRNDLNSPTADILSALSPFTVHDIRTSLEHWVAGYAYTYLPLRQVPGHLALVLFGAGVAGAAVAVVARFRGRLPGRVLGDRRLLLVLALAVAVPAGAFVASLVGTNLFTTRNLAASWPALGLSLGALLAAAGPRARYVTAGLVIGALAIGAVRMLGDQNQRPDYRAAAAFVDRQAAAGDVVVDATGSVSPGPLTPLDVTLDPVHPVVRAGAPAERDHPFNLGDRTIPLQEALTEATRQAAGRRVYLVAALPPDLPAYQQRRKDLGESRIPNGYRVTSSHVFAGFLRVTVSVLERSRG